MHPLEGLTVIALGDMARRPLCRFLRSLGAAIREEPPTIEAATDGDFLVDDVGIEGLAERGLTRDEIARRNQALVHVSVTPFGSGGPRARWRASELVTSAMGGTLRLTGEPDRPPVKEALDACTFHAEMVAAAGAMAAHYSRMNSGRGQHVDVSIQEVTFSRNVSGILVWQFDRRKLQRAGPALNYGKATVRCIWRLADGWCFHSLMTGRFGAPANRALSEWIDQSGLPNPLGDVDWLQYNRSTLDPETRRTWEAAIDRFFRTRTRQEIRTEGRKRGINACAVEEPSDVLEDPHLAARDFWAMEGDFRVPSRFARIKPAAQITAPAIRNEKVSRPGPLAGMRVLDFSWALVGSITTKILGDLGADVVKVESRKRPCLSRIDVQVGASRAGDMDDKPWFAHLNSSKRSLALDLKRPESRDVVEPLVDWADAVVENFSPGTMDKLGLGYAALSARNPGVVMASGSVFGQTGPLSGEWGIDGTGGALSGRTFLTGWPDRDPVVPGSVPYGDVIVPYVMAASIIAALVHRRVRGGGCHIDAAMYEVCVQQMESAIRQSQRGARPHRMGNADPGVLEQNVFPARGEDRWVALTLYDEADRGRLRQLVGDRPIADWTGELEDFDAVEQLQRAGIAAGAVQDIEDLIESDPGLAARGALVELPHPRLGPFGHVRTPIGFSGDTLEPFRAPGLGEHTEEIVLGLTRLSPERFETLRSEGVFE